MTSPTQRRHEELVALLTEIRDRLPEPEGVNAVTDAPVDTAPNEDPDEVLAKALEAANENTVTWLGMARKVREHIEAEREEGGYNIRRAERECKRLTNRADLWRERCQKAEADVEHWRAEFNQADQRIVGLTAERDEWKARYKALLGDVDEMRRGFGRGLWPDFKGVLARDTERGARRTS